MYNPLRQTALYSHSGLQGFMASSDSSVLGLTPNREGSEGIGLVVATLVSYALNPLIFPPLVFGLVLAHVGAPGMDVARAVGVGLVFFALVPLVHVGWMWVQGRIESLEIRDRSKRVEPFLVSLGAGIVALITVLGLEMAGRRLLVAMVGCQVVNTSLLFSITTRWKISVHCASVAGALSVLVFARTHLAGGLLGTALLGRAITLTGAVLVFLMLWARVRSGAHTIGQGIAGTGLGLAAPYLELVALAESFGL